MEEDGDGEVEGEGEVEEEDVPELAEEEWELEELAEEAELAEEEGELEEVAEEAGAGVGVGTWVGQLAMMVGAVRKNKKIYSK